MKTKYIPILALAFGVSAWTLNAQDQPPPPPPDAAPGDNGGPPGPPPGGDKDGDQHGPPHGRHPVPAIIKALDANGDGVIDSDEMKNAGDALKSLDKDGDGKLTREEYMGPPPPRPDGKDDKRGKGDQGDQPPPPPPDGGKDDQGGPPPPGDDGPRDGQQGPPHHHPPLIIGALDANHDKVIDASEIANATKVLKGLDKNGDGKLTPDEFMGKPPQPPQGGQKDSKAASGPGSQTHPGPAGKPSHP